MDMDMEEMFGIRDSASRRGSVASGSDGGSVSDREEDDDDGGRNNPMDEALEVPDPETGGQQEAPKVVKPKRVIKNPMPKLDLARVAGPRGIPSIPKYFKNVKFQGKGHEKEDLDILLKHLEHWAHRLYPRYPFNNVLEHMEKLGVKKPVKVMMKRYRLDMFDDQEVNRDANDDVVIQEEDVDPEPVVDVFDELLGPAFPSSSQPAVIPPKPKSVTLTSEQRERVERNKRLAEERRLARMREQQNSAADISLETSDDITPSMPGVGASADQGEDFSALMETEEYDQVPCIPKDPKLHGSPVIEEGTSSEESSFGRTLETSKEQKTDRDDLLTESIGDSASGVGASADQVEDSSALMETEEYDQVPCTPKDPKVHGSPVMEEGTSSEESSSGRTLETSKEQKTDRDDLLTESIGDSASGARTDKVEDSFSPIETEDIVDKHSGERGQTCTSPVSKLHGTPVIEEGAGCVESSFCRNIERTNEQKTDSDNLSTSNTDSALDNNKLGDNIGISSQKKSEGNLEEIGQGNDSENGKEKENLCTEEDMLTMLEDDV